jgi:hypothetical protein
MRAYRRLGALGRRFSLCCERAQIMRFCAGDAVPETFTGAVGSTGAVDGLWSRKCYVAESARIEDSGAAARCRVCTSLLPEPVHPWAARTHAGGPPKVVCVAIMRAAAASSKLR